MTIQLPPEVEAFLQRPGQMAILATVSNAQFPHLTPVWYQYDEAVISSGCGNGDARYAI